MKNINGLQVERIEVNLETEIVYFHIQHGTYSMLWAGEQYLIEALSYMDGKVCVVYTYEGEAVTLDGKKIIDDLEEKELDTEKIEKKLSQIGKTYLDI